MIYEHPFANAINVLFLLLSLTHLVDRFLVLEWCWKMILQTR